MYGGEEPERQRGVGVLSMRDILVSIAMQRRSSQIRFSKAEFNRRTIVEGSPGVSAAGKGGKFSHCLAWVSESGALGQKTVAIGVQDAIYCQ